MGGKWLKFVEFTTNLNQKNRRRDNEHSFHLLEIRGLTLFVSCTHPRERDPELIPKLSVANWRGSKPINLHCQIRSSQLFIQPRKSSGRCSKQRWVGRQWPLCSKAVSSFCPHRPPQPRAFINVLKPQLNEPLEYFFYGEIPMSVQTFGSWLQ